jgi:hypothetical protein
MKKSEKKPNKNSSIKKIKATNESAKRNKSSEKRKENN